MRNDEVHQGLEKKEVRDLLAEQSWETGWTASVNYSVAWYEEEIVRLQEKLALARRHVTIRKIADEYGWQFYDISDEYADYDPNRCLDFVGTAEEHANRFKLEDKTA